MTSLHPAAILVVGTELLREGRVDTNGPRMAMALEQAGLRPVLRMTVGDSRLEIAGALAHLAGQAKVVLVSGGLGPTFDDLTREGAADAFGLELIRRQELVSPIQERYAARGMEAPEEVLRMADLLAGAEVLANSVGSAPGQYLAGPPVVALVPGVPSEMEAMVRDEILPRLARAFPGAPPPRRLFKIAGLYESQVESLIGPVLRESQGREREHETDATILASPGEVTLILRQGSASAAALDRTAGEVRRVLGRAIYSEHEEGIEAVVGRMLAERGATLSTAESCTAGLLGALITSVPGSSAWYRGGIVCYADEVKESLLQVPARLIEEKGAVSEETALALAAGAARRLATDFALSLTGVAGPGGGSPGKPVGTVCLGIHGPSGERAVRLSLGGAREVIRKISCRGALNLLRLTMLKEKAG